MGLCFSKYEMITVYNLYENKFHRNWSGTPYCMWCHYNITNTDKVLLQCIYCKYIIGHQVCKTYDECPKCKV